MSARVIQSNHRQRSRRRRRDCGQCERNLQQVGRLNWGGKQFQVGPSERLSISTECALTEWSSFKWKAKERALALLLLLLLLWLRNASCLSRTDGAAE